jgi:hypothetical protein
MANEYLQRTPTSTGNRKVFTWAGWIKRDTTTEGYCFGAGTSNSNRFALVFNGSGSVDGQALTPDVFGFYKGRKGLYLCWFYTRQLISVQVSGFQKHQESLRLD